MKIKILRDLSINELNFKAGVVVELEDGVAQMALNSGRAEKVQEKPVAIKEEKPVQVVNKSKKK